MMARTNHLWFISAPLNFQGTQFRAHMPNPGWQVSSREQLLRDQLQRERQEFQLQCERQEFQAWKLEMSKKLAQGSQPRPQAPPLVNVTGLSDDIDASGEVVNKS